MTVEKEKLLDLLQTKDNKLEEMASDNRRLQKDQMNSSLLRKRLLEINELDVSNKAAVDADLKHCRDELKFIHQQHEIVKNEALILRSRSGQVCVIAVQVSNVLPHVHPFKKIN